MVRAYRRRKPWLASRFESDSAAYARIKEEVRRFARNDIVSSPGDWMTRALMFRGAVAVFDGIDEDAIYVVLPESVRADILEYMLARGNRPDEFHKTVKNLGFMEPYYIYRFWWD